MFKNCIPNPNKGGEFPTYIIVNITSFTLFRYEFHQAVTETLFTSVSKYVEQKTDGRLWLKYSRTFASLQNNIATAIRPHNLKFIRFHVLRKKTIKIDFWVTIMFTNNWRNDLLKFLFIISTGDAGSTPSHWWIVSWIGFSI